MKKNSCGKTAERLLAHAPGVRVGSCEEKVKGGRFEPLLCKVTGSRGGRKGEGQTEKKNGWKIMVSETVNTNHNQMGKSSNSGKRFGEGGGKVSQREKEGGKGVGGRGILSSPKRAFSF